VKYVIIRVERKSAIKDKPSIHQDFPFLFPNEVVHKTAAESFQHLLFRNFDGSLLDAQVFSAGFFTPEQGAMRGSESLGIASCERNDPLSIFDDNLICVIDQTKGIVR
jgi:hypothetical protein